MNITDFIFGFFYGLILTIVHFLLFMNNIRLICKIFKINSYLFFTTLFLFRFFLTTVFIIIFLKFKIGSIQGLLAGITAAIILFLLKKVFYDSYSRSSKV